jgi:hypothetical protein
MFISTMQTEPLLMTTLPAFRSILCRVAPAAKVVLALVLLVSITAPALADEFVRKVNADYAKVQPSRRTETILFPVMSKMEAPPKGLERPLDAAMLPPTGSAWSAAETWANAKPQRDMLDAIKKVTEVEQWKDAFALAQPYGADAADPDQVIEGLFTDLGDPPLLGAADFKYLPRWRTVEVLLHIEATRLQKDGKPLEALDLMVRNLWLGRQMADRVMFREAATGYAQMMLALQRLRDVAFVDSRLESPLLTPENVRDIGRRLREPQGLLGIDRLLMPQGDRIAAEQLISKTMLPGAGANPDTFSPVLAAITSRGRPLRLFSETARWDALRSLHADTNQTAARLRIVYDDYTRRWALNYHDPALRTPYDYTRTDRTRFSSMDVFVRDISQLFRDRHLLRVEAEGTRNSLALYGYRLQNRRSAPSLAALRPTYLQNLELDVYDPRRAATLSYFVPMTRAVANAQPRPHEMQVFPELLDNRYQQFQISLRDDTFVLYSAGPDGSANGAVRATQTTEDSRGDYVLWPPMLSLVRKNLDDQGRFR